MCTKPKSVYEYPLHIDVSLKWSMLRRKKESFLQKWTFHRNSHQVRLCFFILVWSYCNSVHNKYINSIQSSEWSEILIAIHDFNKRETWFLYPRDRIIRLSSSVYCPGIWLQFHIMIAIEKDIMATLVYNYRLHFR